MEIWQALYLSCVPFGVLALVFGMSGEDWHRKVRRRYVYAAFTSLGVAVILFLAATWAGIGS